MIEGLQYVRLQFRNQRRTKIGIAASSECRIEGVQTEYVTIFVYIVLNYAQTLIRVNLIVVNLLRLFNFTRNGCLRC